MTGRRHECSEPDCTLATLAGLGFDDDQVSFVLGLMDQTFTAGYVLARVYALGAVSVMERFLAGELVDLGPAPAMDGAIVKRAVANVQRRRAMPASPDVAEAMRKSAS